MYLRRYLNDLTWVIAFVIQYSECGYICPYLTASEALLCFKIALNVKYAKDGYTL